MMKGWFAGLFVLQLWLIPSLAEAQGTYARDLNIYLEAYSAEQQNPYAIARANRFLERTISGFINEHDEASIQKIFYKIHHHFLTNFDASATFSETLSGRKYNCLTGTALYAITFHKLGIPFKIIETNYHIFLFVQTSRGNVLIETTDGVNGFVTDAEEISKRIELYRTKDMLEANTRHDTYYRFKFKIYKSVSLNELTGLFFLNNSIAAFNKNNLRESIQLLEKASMYYSSPRIEEFANLILLTVKEKVGSTSEKAEYSAALNSLLSQ